MKQYQITYLLKRGKPTRTRILCVPAWSPGRPYCVFENGRAGPTFASVEEAKKYLGAEDLKWSEPR